MKSSPIFTRARRAAKLPLADGWSTPAAKKGYIFETDGILPWTNKFAAGVQLQYPNRRQQLTERSPAEAMSDNHAPGLQELLSTFSELTGLPSLARRATTAKLKAEIWLDRHRFHSDAAFLDSVRRLDLSGKALRKFAVVGPMPPAETGIANFTLQTFRNCSGGVDIFTTFESLHAYAHFACEEPRKDLGVEMFELAALPKAVELRDYDAIIICIGNSSHNRPFAELLATLATFPPAVPVLLHLHDPWLFDLWDWTAATMGRSSRSDLESLYGISAKGFRATHRVALAGGAFGVSALIGAAPVCGIIVNSRAAEILVQRDLSLAGIELPIVRAFLPVLPPLVAVREMASTEMPIKIGAFGYPGAAKRSRETVQAAHLLIGSGKASEIVIAGYSASNFVKSLPTRERKNVRHQNAPADFALEILMSQIDVAVQLRRGNRGESSGIVSQLLAQGKPVVVSATGSFREFGDAVVQIPADANPATIAAAILEAFERRVELSEKANAYCAAHSPQRFISVLDAFVTSLKQERHRTPDEVLGSSL